MATTDTLITKYRPTKWSDFVGHQSEIASLRDAVANDSSHCFMFGGKPGIGKTSLAYKVAASLGGENTKADIIEIPAAVYTGVSDMRDILVGLNYRPLMGEAKVLLLDEAHRLSKNAVDSILIATEKPPSWVYWIFCSSMTKSLPQSLKRRCLHFELKEVSKNELYDFLGRVADEEQLQTPNEVLDVCARAANGSPGQALANLGACVSAKDRAEASSLLRTATKDTEAVELARALLDCKPWEQMQPILFGLRETDAESVRHTVRAYFSTILISEQDPAKAAALASLIEPFCQPFYDFTDVAMAVCKIAFEVA